MELCRVKGCKRSAGAGYKTCDHCRGLARERQAGLRARRRGEACCEDCGAGLDVRAWREEGQTRCQICRDKTRFRWNKWGIEHPGYDFPADLIPWPRRRKAYLK